VVIVRARLMSVMVRVSTTGRYLIVMVVGIVPVVLRHLIVRAIQCVAAEVV